MQQCLKPYGCGDTSKTVLKIVCFGKSVFCRKNRDAPIVLNVTVMYVDVSITENVILSDHTKQFLDVTTNGDLPRILEVPEGITGLLLITTNHDISF